MEITFRGKVPARAKSIAKGRGAWCTRRRADSLELTTETGDRGDVATLQLRRDRAELEVPRQQIVRAVVERHFGEAVDPDPIDLASKRQSRLDRLEFGKADRDAMLALAH